MKPAQIWANLAVEDVHRTHQFYTTLGFEANTGHGKDDKLTSIRFGKDGFVVNFFKTAQMEQAMNGPVSDTAKGNEIMFTLSVESPEEADAWAEEVRKAGGHIFSEPAAFGPCWYGFGFADPDGHKWNVFKM